MFETSVDIKYFEREISNARLGVTLTDPYEIAEWLPDLANGKIRVIRVPNWRSASDCVEDVGAMEKCIAGSYALEPSLAKGGPTVYDFEGREEDSPQYFKQASIWNPDFAAFCTHALRQRIILPRF